MVSEIQRDPRLDDRVVFYPCDAEKAFLEHRMVVLDGVGWDCDMAVLRTGLEKKKRGFKAPFHGEVTPAVDAERVRLDAHAERIFAQLFPSFHPIERNGSWRPMITGPEPMHFDTHPGEVPSVVSFLNIADTPRIYRVGENFQQLVQRQPDLMRQLYAEVGRNADEMSYRIRCRTVKNQPPLDDDSPRHTVKFAPGAIWFFNAKTVSHEVVYGEGATAFGWPVPDCGAATQRSLLGL